MRASASTETVRTPSESVKYSHRALPSGTGMVLPRAPRFDHSDTKWPMGSGHVQAARRLGTSGHISLSLLLENSEMVASRFSEVQVAQQNATIYSGPGVTHIISNLPQVPLYGDIIPVSKSRRRRLGELRTAELGLTLWFSHLQSTRVGPTLLCSLQET